MATDNPRCVKPDYGETHPAARTGALVSRDDWLRLS